MITRKQFIQTALAGTTGALFIPALLHAQTAPVKPVKGDPLDKTLVKEFVKVAHTNFDQLKTMLAETPDLLNAVHNLGGWDWEDAIGAAGHVGNREMALFLLEKGARPTICVAAMLGELKLVKTYIKAFPHNGSEPSPARSGIQSPEY